MENKKKRKVKMGYRDDINRMIMRNDLESLLKKTSELHGHICSHSAYGVKAGYYAMKNLAVTNTGMEEVIAVLETNNCFSDGIQMVTGCTFGNNALIFNDVGKTAVTVINRMNKNSIRLVLNKGFWDSREEVYPKVFGLFKRIVTERQKVSDLEKKEFFKLTEQMAMSELKVPETDMFDIKMGKAEPLEYAPIYDSVTCSVCGESIIENRARIKEEKPVCIKCSADWFFYMDGYGISYKKYK
jgi:formylmethanofuran dehydrogenase subunit E